MTYRPLFPAALQPATLALLRTLSGCEPRPLIGLPFVLRTPVFASGAAQRLMPGFTVSLQGEALSAPSRVYCAPEHLRSVIARSEGDMRILAFCIGTRHWDGHIREECLRQLVGADRPWVVPFVVQLLGEYVIEIVEAIVRALPGMNPAHSSRFVRENTAFMATTRRRATSYWSCYHRCRFPALRTYPGIVALDAIERRRLQEAISLEEEP